MYCYLVKETSGLKTLVTCDNKEQAQELFKRDLDNYINNFGMIDDYAETISNNRFTIDYELDAWIEDLLPADIELRKALPTHLGGWNIFTYKQYKNLDFA